MKRARRVSVWLIVMAMVCSLMGCAKEPELTPEEVYMAAYEKLNALTSMDAEVNMDASMTAEGETVEMGMDMGMLMENRGSEDMKIAMEMNMDMLGISINIQAYYTEGYYLMEMLGQKIKYAMSLEDALDQAVMMQEVEKEALSEITMTEEEGIRTLKFTLDPNKIADGYMDEYFDTMGISDVEGDGIAYENMTGTMTVNEEGYPMSICMNIACVIEVDGVAMEGEAVVEVRYNNPGQPVTVEIPDASEYIEVDPEAM